MELILVLALTFVLSCDERGQYVILYEMFL